eukprot:Phypoly_transcript_05170.p1 GENE.Phypoly_transcript_05170~~Phypoly_transcript_05170.p1  ORF type:complete len:487 (+),score=116.94 Phypoly_transcript_05170:90-1550(+)
MESLGYVKFELEKTQKALLDYKNRLERAQQENKTLTEDRDKIKQDAEEIIDYLRSTNESKEQAIEKLKQDLIHQKDSLTEEKSQLRVDLEKHIKELTANLMEYEVQVQTLQGELEIVQDFRNQRETLLQDLEDSKRLLEEATSKSKEKVTKLERKYYEEKVRLQKEVATKMAEMKKESEQKAIAHLAQSAKAVFVQNQTLEDELLVHSKASESLAKAREKFEVEAKDLRRELDLSRGRLKEYAYLTHKQGKEIEMLMDKIKTMDITLANLSRRQRDPKSENLESELNDSKLDANALKRLLYLKGIELRKIRLLAHEIIDQRSDLEQYFHDSLEYVKNEKARQLQKQTTKLSPKTTTTTTQFKIDATQQIRLEDLTWEEKERVLRILFSKINSAQSLGKPKHLLHGDSEESDTLEGDQVKDKEPEGLEPPAEPPPHPPTAPSSQPPSLPTISSRPPTSSSLSPHSPPREDPSLYYGMVSSGDYPPLA